jgi:SAM-dependent methyltransferase
MLDVQNPEIEVDDIMQRIQEKVRQRHEHPAAPRLGGPAAPGEALGFKDLLAQARDNAQIGMNLPAMTRTQGLKRALATPVAKLFLRIAQLITRDQRVFNQAVLTALQSLHDQLARSAADAAARADRSAAVLAQANASLSQRLEALEAQLRAAQEEGREKARKAEQLRVAVSLQERRLTLLLEEARRRLPQPLDAKQLQTFADELPRVHDAGYLGFEDTFRGTREDIKERVSIYLPKLRAAGAGTRQAPVLDLGCGRGELLEVLRDQGLEASGVDSNAAAVDKCRELKLAAMPGDLFEALAGLPDGSLGGVTALHVVEHLPFPLVLRLLDETLRVLRPGGIAIFETPNPTNLQVGASTFYIDPTHRNPVHPLTLHYLAEARGLVQVETLMLHPFPKEARLPEDTAEARLLNESLFGPQDYAVLGRRP